MEKVVEQDGVTIVELSRYYDLNDEAANDRVRELLGELVQSADPPLLLVDLSHTVGINSTFIGCLFATGSAMKKRGGRFALCSADAYCAETLRIVRLGDMFPSYETRHEALADLLSDDTGTA